MRFPLTSVTVTAISLAGTQGFLGAAWSRPAIPRLATYPQDITNHMQKAVLQGNSLQSCLQNQRLGYNLNVQYQGTDHKTEHGTLSLNDAVKGYQ